VSYAGLVQPQKFSLKRAAASPGPWVARHDSSVTSELVTTNGRLTPSHPLPIPHANIAGHDTRLTQRDIIVY
jgi:hypothetical protein